MLQNLLGKALFFLFSAKASHIILNNISLYKSTSVKEENEEAPWYSGEGNWKKSLNCSMDATEIIMRSKLGFWCFNDAMLTLLCDK